MSPRSIRPSPLTNPTIQRGVEFITQTAKLTPLQRADKLGAPALAFLLVMWLGYTVYAIDRTVLSSVLAPLSSSLTLSNQEVGLLGSAQYIGVLLIVGLAGHISDRYGRRAVLIAGVIIFTSFTWLIGFASNFAEAFLFRLVSGVGEGFFWPVAMAAVASFFGKRKGFALGFFYVGFDVGSVAGLSIGGVTYALYGDWHQAFFIAPLIGLPVIVGAYLAKGQFARGNLQPNTVRLGKDALQLLGRRNVLLIMLFAFLATAASVWQVVFLPYYFFKVMNFSVLSSAILSSLVAVSGAGGKLLLGGVSDVWRRNRMLFGLSALVVIAYVVFFASTNFYLALAGALAMGFLSSAIFPIMQALMADSCDGKTGTALGLTTTCQSVATVISPIISASLFVLGVGKALALVATVPAVAMAVVALLIAEPRVRTVVKAKRY